MLGKTHLAAGVCASGAIVMANSLNPTGAAIATAGILLGALLPDIDSKNSTISQAVKPVGVIVSALAGHRKLFHDPVFYGLIFAGLWFTNQAAANWFIPLFIGIATHLFLDAQNPMGIPILYIAKRWRLRLLAIPTGSFFDKFLGGLLGLMGLVCFAKWIASAI